MTSSLESLIATAPSGRPRPVLLDHDDYATAVIRQGVPIPWTDLASLTGHAGRVHALLDPDATWIDAGALYDAHLAANAELATAMGARSRTGFPLRTLLGDENGVARVVRTGGTLADTTRRPLVLAPPSPARWLARAHVAAGRKLDSVDDVAADTASMYLAEWLGRLGTLPVALVLLDARAAPGDGPVETPESLSAYSAIANVAEHFGWTVAIRHDQRIEVSGGAPDVGLVPEEFWLGDAPLPAGAVLLATIPASAPPEQVLDRLARTR